MTPDAVWNGGMGILAYTWRGGKEKGESVKYGATRHRKIERAAQRTKGNHLFPAAVTEVPRPSLSCGHGLRSRVFLRRHLPSNGLACHCPVWQKQGKAIWRQETRSRREWSQVQIHACRVLHPAAFPVANGNEKKENDKTVPTVQHKHIKEVPTTMAVSLVTLPSSWAFLRLCRF